MAVELNLNEEEMEILTKAIAILLRNAINEDMYEGSVEMSISNITHKFEYKFN